MQQTASEHHHGKDLWLSQHVRLQFEHISSSLFRFALFRIAHTQSKCLEMRFRISKKLKYRNLLPLKSFGWFWSSRRGSMFISLIVSTWKKFINKIAEEFQQDFECNRYAFRWAVGKTTWQVMDSFGLFIVLCTGLQCVAVQGDDLRVLTWDEF